MTERRKRRFAGRRGVYGLPYRPGAACRTAPRMAPHMSNQPLPAYTILMPQTEQTLRITVNIETEEGVRVKEYSDHSEFLSDLRDWRRYADKNDLRFQEETSTTLTLGDERGPLFTE